MYRPPHFVEDRLDRLHATVDANPLGLLVTVGIDGLVANPIPFLVDPAAGPLGTLHAHVARNNPVWREPLAVPEVLVVFQGPDGYVSPNWYPSKAETHRTVPTWNYLVVQAHGPLVVHDDVKWLRAQAGRLTRKMERDQPTPWRMADAPRDYTDEQLGQIVGIEIPISRISGKAKLSQNRIDADRDGAETGLRESGHTDLADLMAATRIVDDRD